MNADLNTITINGVEYVAKSAMQPVETGPEVLILNPFKAWKNWRDRKKAEREERAWRLLLREVDVNLNRRYYSDENAHYDCGDKD